MGLRTFAISLFLKFRFLFAFRIISVVLVIASALGFCLLLAAQETTPTADRTKQAIGLKPLRANATPAEREAVRLNHEFFNDMLAERRKHDAALAELQPVLARLFMPESFANKQQAQEIIDALKKMLDIDGAMTETMEHAPEEYRKRLDNSKLGAKAKNAVMQGFQRGYGSPELLGLYRQGRSREVLWVASSVDLYNFAIQHAGNISLREGKLTIAGDELVEQFNLKVKNANTLREQMHETNEQMRVTLAERMQKIGVTNSDLGLPEKPKQ